MQLAQPSWQLASNILRELDHDERITIYLLKSRGVIAVDLHNFEGAVDLLNVGKVEDFSSEDLLFPGAKAVLAWVDPQTLVEWVRTVFADWELALAIRQSLLFTETATYPEKIMPIRELLELRLAQCKKAIGEAVKSA